jgi:hypothetical protein
MMLAYLPMEGGATNAVKDYSGSGHHGTAGGTPNWLSTSGFDGHGCYLFDGTGGDRIDLPNIMPTAGAYTKTAWVYVTRTTGMNNIISGSTNPGHAFWVSNHPSNFRLSAGHADPWRTVVDPVDFTANVWTFVAVTYDPAVDGGTMKLFKNGVQVGSTATGVTAIASDTSAHIGSYGTSANMQGRIDDARIYNFALSPEQISAMYNGGAGDSNIIVSQETTIGEVWRCDVTPFSSTEAGTTESSNTLTIQDCTVPTPPTIVSTPVIDAMEGKLYTYDVEAIGDPTPTFSLTTFPVGMTVDPVTGLIEWIPDETQIGPNTVIVVATNTEGTDDQEYTVLVSESPCPPDISHYWHFDDCVPPYEDYWAGNDATCTNCPDCTTGIVNDAVQFNGVDDAVNVVDDDTFDWGASDSFSIELWMKRSGTIGENDVIVGRDDAGTSLHWWCGLEQTSGKPWFYLIATNGDSANIKGNTNVNDGNWHHIVYMKDGGNLRIYVDGVEDATPVATSYSAGFDSSTNLNIGWLNLGSGYYYDGVLDELALYDRALTLDEIEDHWNNGLGKDYCEVTCSTNTVTDVVTEYETVTQYSTDTVTQSFTDVITEYNTVTQYSTDTVTQSFTDVITEYETVTQYSTDTVTQSFTDVITEYNTVTQYSTDTVTQSFTDVITEYETVTQYSTDTVTQSFTDTVTQSDTVTESFTDTVTQPVTDTVTQSFTDTVTQSFTDTVTQSDTVTESFTDTVTKSDTVTQSDTVTESFTDTVTQSATTETATATETVTQGSTETVYAAVQMLSGDVYVDVGGTSGIIRGKPAGTAYAAWIDSTAGGVLLGMAENGIYFWDYDTAYVDPSTGEPTGVPAGETLVTSGGPLVNGPVKYYEANRIAEGTPAYYGKVGGVQSYLKSSDDSVLAGINPTSTHDMFIIEIFEDSQGRTVIIVYGLAGRGTLAGALYFVDNADYFEGKSGFWIYEWTDNPTDGTQMHPDPPSTDTYSLVTSG